MLDGYIRGELSTLASALLAIDIALLFVLRLFVRGARKRLALPLGFLVVGVVVLGMNLALIDTRAAAAMHVAALFCLMLSMGRSGFLLIIDGFLTNRLIRPIPKIVREIVQGLIYAAIALVALNRAGVNPTSILTTSALLTAIIGLSLQDTLGNLFAGLAIQAELPFVVGDWIRFDEVEERIGKVIEINWRATKLLTIEQVTVIVPNAVLAKAALMNFTRPTPICLQSVHVSAPYDVPPERVREIILAALPHVEGIVSSPAPTVFTREFSERGVSYWIRYYIHDFAARFAIASDVRDRVWYALSRAQIEISVLHHDVRLYEQSPEEEARHRDHDKQARKEALATVRFFDVVPAPLLDHLSDLVHTRLYTHDEVVFEQGDRGDEFYVVLRGEVSVQIRTNAGRSAELTRLGPGKFFGEMSLLMDTRRAATIVTTSETSLLVIGRAALQQILDQSPQLAETINKALHDRQEMLNELREEAERLPSESFHAPQGVFLNRIREFFSL